MLDLHSFDSPHLLSRKLAAHIATLLARDIERDGRATLAVSGGKTPVELFQQLSTVDIGWDNVDITLVDERCVAASSADSNENLVRKYLLQNRAANAHFYGLMTSHVVPGEGLGEVTLRLAKLRRPFSAVLLGMGGDGHSASWFPQAANLAELLNPSGGTEIAVTDPVTAPHLRITLTLSAVLKSREIIIHITGQDKKAVLEEAGEHGYPIASVLKQSSTPVSIWWAP